MPVRARVSSPVLFPASREAHGACSTLYQVKRCRRANIDGKCFKCITILQDMTKTKKVGSTGRFGARYGRKIRTRVLKIEKLQNAKHSCPKCNKPGVKRLATGIWFCKKCGAKFAGKAYVPE